MDVDVSLEHRLKDWVDYGFFSLLQQSFRRRENIKNRALLLFPKVYALTGKLLEKIDELLSSILKEFTEKVQTIEKEKPNWKHFSSLLETVLKTTQGFSPFLSSFQERQLQERTERTAS